MYINIIDIPNFLKSSQDKVDPESENQISTWSWWWTWWRCPKVACTHCDRPSEDSMGSDPARCPPSAAGCAAGEEIAVSGAECGGIAGVSASEVTIDLSFSHTGNLSVPRWGKHFFMFYRTFGCRKGNRERKPWAFCIYGLETLRWGVKWKMAYARGQICELSSETESSSSSAADTSKAHVSSSPALSSDLPSHDIAAHCLHSHLLCFQTSCQPRTSQSPPKLAWANQLLPKGSFLLVDLGPDRYADFNDSAKKDAGAVL